mmetsp:Transcript_39121/g.120906  ORF Transcript_39121/g.120906 Transcript_39121/m.120906 type:complete len:211 (-) Transcript_39121:1346-1978(-)
MMLDAWASSRTRASPRGGWKRARWRFASSKGLQREATASAKMRPARTVTIHSDHMRTTVLMLAPVWVTACSRNFTRSRRSASSAPATARRRSRTAAAFCDSVMLAHAMSASLPSTHAGRPVMSSPGATKPSTGRACGTRGIFGTPPCRADWLVEGCRGAVGRRAVAAVPPPRREPRRTASAPLSTASDSVKLLILATVSRVLGRFRSSLP